MVFCSFVAAAGPRLASRGCCALLALSVACLHFGCSLDERTLTLEASGAGTTSGGSAGRAATGAGGTQAGRGGAQPDGDAGQAGSADQSQAGQAGDASDDTPTFADGCTDLDHSGASDCTETLLDNPNFATDVSAWRAETGATLSWDPLDLMGVAGSGSALVTSSMVIDATGASLVAADQCLAVEAGQILDVYAQVRTEAGPVDGNAAISLWFFPTPECGESPSSFYQTAPIETSRTVVLHGSAPVPDFMVSVRVRLAVIKPFRAESYSARFDNLLLVAR